MIYFRDIEPFHDYLTHENLLSWVEFEQYRSKNESLTYENRINSTPRKYLDYIALSGCNFTTSCQKSVSNNLIDLNKNKVSHYVLRFSPPFLQIFLCVVSIYSAKQAISDDVIIAKHK